MTSPPDGAPRTRRLPMAVAGAAAAAAVAVAAAALVVVVRSGGHTTTRAAGPPATTAPTTVPATPSTTVATTTSTAGGGVATTTTSVSGADNLSATDDVKAALVTAYVQATAGLTPSDVVGTTPGTVYYARDTDSGYSYAVAEFQPSAAYQGRFGNLPPSAPARAAFQDGPYAFTEAFGGSWQESAGLGSTSTCPPFPAPVLAVWGMTPSACTFSSGA